MRRPIFLLAFIFITNVAKTTGCGTSTHISIAHEAATFFKGPADEKIDYAALLWKHQDAFVAGNPYPDAMYPSLCFGGKYHDTAEDTHWAPFLNATVHYIRNNYPQPWNKETEKLVAFLFGFVSHQVADVTWHSLGIDQGLIRAMTDLNFHGVYDTAHTDADVGGDMLTQFYEADQPISTSTWYVPVDDLYNIYKDYYHDNKTIPKLVIELCSELLYIEYVAEKLAGAKIFKPFVKTSPFLYNQMENYFLGGIHDMSAWTSKIWNDVIYMLEHGTETCNVEHNTLFVNCTGYLPGGKENMKNIKNPGRRYPLIAGKWNSQHVNKDRTGRGIYFSPGEDMQKEIDRKWKSNPATMNIQSPETGHSYSQTGRSMTTIEMLGKSHLVTSAPTYSEQGAMHVGKVWVVAADNLSDIGGDVVQLSDMDGISEIVLYGNESMSKFGWSLAVTYYNDDEFQDLIVSAPVTGSNILKYNGAVYIYFGSKTGLSTTPDIVLKSFKNETSHSKYANFGYTLAQNINKKHYLMAGNPFYATRRENDQNGIAWVKSTNDSFQWFRLGYNNYTWFGYSMVNEVLSSTSDDLLVIGSPTHRFCHLANCSFHALDKQSVGFVMTFLNFEESAYLTGTEEFEEFGTSIAIGKPYNGNSYVVAISSPGKQITAKIFGVDITLRQAGMVQVFNLTHIEDPNRRQVLATFYGDRSYGRFGEGVMFYDVDGDDVDELIISAPRRSRDFTEEFEGGEEGAVYIYKLTSTNNDVNDCPELGITPCPSEKAWKYFVGSEAHARFGASIQILDVKDEKRLIVGSTTSSKSAFRAGLVQSIDVSS